MQNIHHYDLFEFSAIAQSEIKLKFDDFFNLTDKDALVGKAIILKPKYQWKVVEDEFGVKVLLPFENGNTLSLDHLAGIIVKATDGKLKIRNGGMFKDKGFKLVEDNNHNCVVFELNSVKHIAFVDKNIDLEKDFRVLENYPVYDWLKT